jgi:hypothetical protein
MKLSKLEAREYRKKKMERATQGEGLYIFRNKTSGDLMLPKPAEGGVRTVTSGQEFQGDSYFMCLVKTNQCSLVQELVSPKQTREQKMQEEKLLLDQPDQITAAGQVEHVVAKQPQQVPLNEVPVAPETPATDVLLTEDPLDGVDIIGE